MVSHRPILCTPSTDQITVGANTTGTNLLAPPQLSEILWLMQRDKASCSLILDDSVVRAYLERVGYALLNAD